MKPFSIIFFIIFIPFLFYAQIQSQNLFQNRLNKFNYEKADTTLSDELQGIYWNKALISLGSLATVNVVVWNYYVNTWYNKTSVYFQFRDDWYDHSLNVDKLGHFWTSTVLHKTVYKLCQWSNFSLTQSLLISSTFAWLQMLPIEIKDGYYITYGFAWTDLMANTLGSIYPSLQIIYPGLQAFNLKMSMHITPNYRVYYQIRNPIDDYEGRTFWLSIDVNKLLPQKWDKYWPDWLCIAVGYGGSNMFTPSGNWNIDKNRKGLGTQEWYIALDYNLIEIFKPKEGTFFFQFLDFLNMIHLPAPTLRIKPNSVFFGLYF